MRVNSVNTAINKNEISKNNKLMFCNNGVNQTSTVNVKGNKGKKGDDWISRLFGKTYGKLYDKEWIQKCIKFLNKVPGNVTAHMVVFGSAITSGVYMLRTLHNKDLDPDKRRTLAINQLLCFIIPSVLGYLINEKLTTKNKAKEYKYSAKQEAKMALANLSKEELEKQIARNGARLKGFRALQTLATFTLIYRYATPVLVTPAANKIGDKLNENKKIKEQKKLSINKQSK